MATKKITISGTIRHNMAAQGNVSITVIDEVSGQLAPTAPCQSKASGNYEIPVTLMLPENDDKVRATVYANFNGSAGSHYVKTWRVKITQVDIDLQP